MGSLEAHATVPVDDLPRVVEFADLNHDGVRDAIAALVTESTVMPVVVLIRRGSATVALFADKETAREMQFRFEDAGLPPGCVDSLLPRAVASNDRGVLVEARTGVYQSPVDCATASRALIRVEDSVLVVVK
jgi:hypothetical protein